MSRSATGSVLDPQGAGLSGLRVILHDVSRQYDMLLKETLTDSTGEFSLNYADDSPEPEKPGEQIRRLRLRIRLGQLVVKEVNRDDDPSQDTLTFDPIRLPNGVDTSWWTVPDPGQPNRLTTGNAIRWLADNESAWGRVADVIENASILDVMQLSIEVDKYDHEVTNENPKVVLKFDPSNPLLDPNNPRAINLNDKRFERMILERYQQGVDVRILFPTMSYDKNILGLGLVALGTGLFLAMVAPLAGIALIAIDALAIGGGVLAVADLLAPFIAKWAHFFDPYKSENEQWFKKAIEDATTSGHSPPPQVRVRELRLRSMFVNHGKIVIDRGKEAILLGSPFQQAYFDSPQHDIDDPRRGGDAKKGPIHDVSVGVRGPAVGYLQEVFNLHWNLADNTDLLPMPQDPNFTFPAKVDSNDASEDEFITSVQVVRTLDKMFTGGKGGGEKGILEAYLRAIHFAKSFIYIENQYFWNDKITDALIDALDAKQDLVVILLLNVTPDEPYSPHWQWQAVEKIRNHKYTDKDTPTKRFGVFSAWTHAKIDNKHPNQRLVDHYIHSKTAIIDNRWATVGSADLDDSSQDFVEFARGILDDNPRNSETNIVIFEETPVEKSAVDALRRHLWAEHLGFLKDGKLNPDDDALNAPQPPAKNWLDVWNSKASEKLGGLKKKPGEFVPAQILPWPSGPFSGHFWNCQSHHDAEKYLQLLFSPDNPEQYEYEVIGEDGPPSFPFAYALPQS